MTEVTSPALVSAVLPAPRCPAPRTALPGLGRSPGLRWGRARGRRRSDRPHRGHREGTDGPRSTAQGEAGPGPAALAPLVPGPAPHLGGAAAARPRRCPLRPTRRRPRGAPGPPASPRRRFRPPARGTAPARRDRHQGGEPGQAGEGAGRARASSGHPKPSHRGSARALTLPSSHRTQHRELGKEKAGRKHLPLIASCQLPLDKPQFIPAGGSYD